MKLTIEEKIRLGAATVQDFADLDPARIAEIKSDGEHTHYRGSTHTAVSDFEKKAAGYSEDRKILRLVASTNDKDHYGDRVSVRGKSGGKGWLLDAYKRQGGVYLWSHNLGAIKAPIGQALKTWRGKVDDGAGGTKDALLQDVEFLSADDGPDDHFKFAETVYLLMSGKGTRSGKGMMGSSVGFIPVKAHNPETKDEREKLGLGPYGLEFHEQLLLENSATPTPANPFASTLGEAKHARAAVKSFEELVLEELRFIEETKLLPASLVNDFRRNAVLGPDDAEEKLSARLRSRVFFFSEDSSTTVPDGYDSVFDLCEEHRAVDDSAHAAIADDPADTIADLISGVADGEVEKTEDGEQIVTLKLNARARRGLVAAYEAADQLLCALHDLVDASEKNTDPDFTSLFGDGLTLDEIASRLASIEAQLATRNSDSGSDDGVPSSKATEPKDERLSQSDLASLREILFPEETTTL